MGHHQHRIKASLSFALHVIRPNDVRRFIYPVETHPPGFLSFSRVIAPTLRIIIGPCNFLYFYFVHPSDNYCMPVERQRIPGLGYIIQFPIFHSPFFQQAWVISSSCSFPPSGLFFLWLLFLSLL